MNILIKKFYVNKYIYGYKKNYNKLANGKVELNSL